MKTILTSGGFFFLSILMNLIFKMYNKKSIIAICGSTRENSSNLLLIKAITALFQDELVISMLPNIAAIPHFNPDADNDTPPEAVITFREQLLAADGILICTPEYAMGVPGTLKNAIDWTVSSSEFSHKPVALITASTMGEKAHQSLIETLKIIESDMPETSRLLISLIKTKMNKEGEITDVKTLEAVQSVMQSLIKTIGG